MTVRTVRQLSRGHHAGQGREGVAQEEGWQGLGWPQERSSHSMYRPLNFPDFIDLSQSWSLFNSRCLNKTKKIKEITFIIKQNSSTHIDIFYYNSELMASKFTFFTDGAQNVSWRGLPEIQHWYCPGELFTSVWRGELQWTIKSPNLTGQACLVQRFSFFPQTWINWRFTWKSHHL